MLTRESILARKLPQETIEVPEWGGAVVVKAMTAAQYLAYIKCVASDPNKDDPHAAVYHMIAHSVFNEDGARIFNDDDVTAIKDQLPHAVVERLADAIGKLLPQKEVAAKN